jgi:exodeoxyribonuclease VII large subunit
MGTNFFDFKEKVTAPAAKPKSAKPLAGSDALTVSQLTSQIQRVVRGGFPSTVLVKGELSKFRPNAASGHAYFTFKDAGACIECVMWKSDVAKLRFTPTQGMELLARGKVDIYGEQGRYQLYVSTLQPLGQGALELAFQQLRAKLEAEGLFAAGRKRPLPAYPTRVVLVTSRETAALQDMLKVLRRYQWVRLFVYHVPVQGDGCGKRIAEGIEHFNNCADVIGGADVIVLARGGGSLEDLWGFNEECVARAVANSRIPVITGIGHEVDTSIADLIADYHAHTPTEAAQVIVAGWRDVREYIVDTTSRLSRSVRSLVEYQKQRLLTCRRHEAFRRPMHRILTLRQTLDERQQALAHKAASRVRRHQDRLTRLAMRLEARHPKVLVSIASEKLAGLARHLSAVSPEQVLSRGYSITTRKRDGVIVRSPEDVRAGQKIVTRVAHGNVESVVDDVRQPRLFE